MLAVFVAFAVTAIAIGASSGPGSSTGSGLVASQHAYLGLQVVDWPAGGALVVNVEPGSPAAISGLETGDLLQEVNGRAINAAADVNAAVGSLRPGRQISVQVVRGAFPYTIEVTLAPRPPGALTP